MKDSKDVLLWVSVWLILIRFWIEAVTTTLLKNSQIINGINNNKVGFHHYQLGFLIVLLSFIAGKFLSRLKPQTNFAMSFGLALFLDQYTFVLSLLRIKLPFEYRSQIDYLIISIFIIGVISFWVYSGKKLKMN